ncbi:MAG TPA: hypothetical protein VF590_04680 [Isosphaeraceae bacterium]|jgi:hypothetical protein
MATSRRIGTGLLLAGSVLLALLMLYTLGLELFDSGSRPAAPTRPDDAAEVAVFYPGRTDWVEFRQGIAATCARGGRGRIVQDGDAAVVLETAAHRRTVRFSWHQARGLSETRDEVRRLARGTRPVAVVGSANTVLTVALADALRDAFGADAPGPVLLVPWATSVRGEGAGPGAPRPNLLDIWSGRTFRFCPNNRYEAELLVRCLAEHEPEAAPARVDILVDRNDPYSVDLAESFGAVIRSPGVAPDAAICPRPADLSAPSPGGLEEVPSLWERQQAKAIWDEATRTSAGRTTWVVLPLQGRPTWRMLTALRDLAPYAPDAADGRLRVLCGDGIGLETLTELARGGLSFPVWCVSAASIPGPARPEAPGFAATTQLQAEIASALILGLDRPAGSAEDLGAALRALRLGAEDRAAWGRSLAFTPAGERDGNDLGHAFTTGPGRPEILAYARGGDGRWREPVVVRRVEGPDRR